MKISAKYLFLLSVVAADFTLMLADQATAQTFTTLHNFTGGKGGGYPWAGLILSGNTLYGTTSMGGQQDSSSNVTGTVFAIDTDGSGFTNLHTFTALHAGPTLASEPTNTDGANPFARLVLSSNTLYGTTWDGGDSGEGTVFRVNTDGTGFTNLYSFTPSVGNVGLSGTNAGGAWCESLLAVLGDTLYGTADFGGTHGQGTIFALSIGGSGFTNLHNFSAMIGNSGSFNGGTNSDGAQPYGGIVQSGNSLYGTAQYGGNFNSGTVFAIETDGTGITNLHSFSKLNSSNFTNSDGYAPEAAPVLSGNTLYGTAWDGGNTGHGTVFALNTDGTGFTNLHNFTGSDGAFPFAGLALSGNTLYGTAIEGGGADYGTVFALNTDGTGFTNLHSFTGNLNAKFPGGLGPNVGGSEPEGSLVPSGSALYGTTEYGGAYGDGTVYSISFAPQLTVALSGTNVILTWPTNLDGFSYAGFTLQSTTNLALPAPWPSVLPGPAVVGAQYVVTNAIAEAQQFYQLSQ